MPARLFHLARLDRNRFVALYAVLVIGLLLTSVAFLYEARVIVKDDALQEQASTVLSTANQAFQDLENAETGQRGYLLTGNKAYLLPYERGTRDVAQAMAQLHRVVADDPPSAEAVRRIDVVSQAKLAELARTIELFRDGNWQEAMALVQTDEGERYMNTLRADFGQLSLRWRTERHEAGDDARRRVVFGAFALAIGAVFVCGLLVYSLVVQQRAFANISAYSKAMDREAARDPLTGLPNRRRLLADIDALASRLDIEEHQVALLYLDVDGFKSVNDVLGHSAGDAFLRKLAKRLSAAVRRDDVLARVGGDEFVALLIDYGDDESLHQLARRLISQIQAVAQAEYAGRFDIGLSIGIATYPDRVSNIRQLTDVADAAMYAAKRDSGSSYRFGPVTANDNAYEVRMSK